MRYLLALLIAVLLAACAAVPTPEPITVPQTVNLPVSASCVPDNLAPRPLHFPGEYADLVATKEGAEFDKLLWARIKGLEARLSVVEPVIEKCRKVK